MFAKIQVGIIEGKDDCFFGQWCPVFYQCFQGFKTNCPVSFFLQVHELKVELVGRNGKPILDAGNYLMIHQNRQSLFRWDQETVMYCQNTCNQQEGNKK